jgi:peptidoglycan/LPS O-acetylase OafA/YrhL
MQPSPSAAAIGQFRAAEHATHPGPQRIPELDGVRGVAILSVLLAHFGVLAAPKGWVANIIGTGWVGVDLFFVLSGYLITGILIDSKREGYFRRFYIRRILRIFPVYYVFVFLLFYVAPRVANHTGLPFNHYGLRDQRFYWLYLANWRDATHQSRYIRHLWSLCIEEQYYMIWPLLVYLIPRNRLKYLCAAMFLVSPIARVAAFHDGVSAHALYRMTPFRLEGLALGSLMAVAARDAQLRSRLKRWLPIAGVVAALGLAVVFAIWGEFFESPGVILYGYTCVAVLAGLLVFNAGRFAAILSARPLLAFGKYSYGLYVWHFPISEYFRIYTDKHPGWITLILAWGAGISLSFAAALVSWVVIERPCLSLKSKWSVARD